MGISPGTVAMLRAEGHDAVHLQEHALERLTDPVILAKAAREERILLTHDLGFGQLMASSGARLPAVIIFRLHNMRPECVNAHLLRILELHREALIQGAVISVAEGRIRLRPLPISDS